MQLTSSAFSNGGIIPSIYTCEGKNLAPPLHVHGAPADAKSLVLILDDPDVPKSLRPDGIYDHWLLFNIPPEATHITTGMHGKNTAGFNRYTGPCPPDREHRYFFKLYALDTLLDLPEGCTKKQIEQAMEGHILAECVLMGRYEKGRGY